jgi:DNA polymerase III sliding clamp (beta) subunit (PCNA family)
VKEIALSRDIFLQALASATLLLSGRKKDARVRIRSNKEDLSLFASDGSCSVHVTLPYKGDAFDLHLPHKALFRLTKAAGENVLLSGKEGEFYIRSGKRTLKLKGSDGEEYPVSPIPGKRKTYMTLSGPDFAKALAQSIRAASRDLSRPSLCAVCFLPREDDLSLLATDSYRLLLYPLKGKNRGKNIASFLVPLHSAKALEADLSKEKPDEVKITYWSEEGGGLSFAYGNKEWNMASLVGQFPDHNDIVPKGGEVLALDTKELLASLKAAEAIQGGFKTPRAQSSVGAMRIQLSHEVSLLLEAPGVGEMKEMLDKATWSGKEMTVGIHPLFLLDMLAVFSSDRVWGRVLSPGEPLVFENEEGRIYLTMPVRLPDLKGENKGKEAS